MEVNVKLFFWASFIVLFSFISISTFSWAQGACMVSALEGQATIVRGQDQPRPVNKFKKLWPGDQLEIAKETTIKLNYLALGRVEQWNGPARIIIEDQGGRDQNNMQQPTIMEIGKLTADLKNSKLLNQQNVAGQIAIRGARTSQVVNAPLDQQGKNELRRIQETYDDLLRKNAKDDVTAEMYYLACLEGLGQKELMARHIHKLLNKNGSNADLEEMLNAL
jgi:hypothetical protein